jgi:hypothetical protein
MHAASADNIARIARIIYPGTVCHMTTIRYIQYLLEKVTQKIEHAKDILSLTNILEGQLSPLFGGITQPDDVILIRDRILRQDTDVITVDSFKEAVVDYTIINFIQTAGGGEEMIHDGAITPWDIRKSITGNEDIASFYETNSRENTLPVNIMVKDKIFTHEMSEELAYGIFISSIVITGKNYPMTMFVAAITEIPPRFTGVIVPQTYTIKLGTNTYTFETSDFIQGLLSVAQWEEKDHHRYWADFFMHKDGVQTTLSF